MSNSDRQALIYGAYGYTGALVTRQAVANGLEPVLAGRRDGPLQSLAREVGCPYRAFGLDEPVAPHLSDIDVVAHCAGPFIDTYRPIVDACLATGTHYLDITGEIPVFEAIKQYDSLARDAGVMILPGGGFDVVPSDCLAAHLHSRLPGATELTLTFDVGNMEVSAGTLKTMVEGLGAGSTVRENGRLVAVPLGGRAKTLDIGDGRQTFVAFPWGDVSTAYHSTQIPNIGVYVPVSARVRRLLGAVDTLSPVLSAGPVRGLLRWIIGRTVDGPDEETRASAHGSFWGEATDGSETVRARVDTPESYRFTAASVVELLGRALDGDVHPGYQTPSSAYGGEFLCSLDGCSLTDIE